jgi:threonylcarbamoyladenosine tRNA methylthiotransferase MtaB
MYRVSFFTLGCKLNQLETEALASAFREEGFTVDEACIPGTSFEAQIGRSSPPELFIINTCTVTSRADQKARRIIRLFLRRGSTVVVTGCYAQLNGKELAGLGSELFIVPGRAKDSLLDLPGFLKNHRELTVSTALVLWQEEKGMVPSAGRADADGASPTAPFRFNPRNFSFHSRAFLKIQDGCDRNCAYCRVPLARGKSISLEAAELVRRLKALESGGIPEAVLTGVNICQYRDPGDAAITLPVLLRMLLENTSHIALRLSSIEPEPEILGDDFFAILVHRRIRNHFHLSVQSGSDRVLSAMGRPYSAADILRTTQKLRTIKDDPFLACDIITGFPGESEGDFEKTAELCLRADFAWIHGFPFSIRPGTRAASMKQQISQWKAGKRLELLLDLARRGRKAYVGRWLGKTVNAVAETGFFSPFFPALADNYIRLLVSTTDGHRPEPGFAFRCRIRELTRKKPEDGFDALGELIL